MRKRLQWARHLETKADDRLPKRAAELREQGRRRRGRPRKVREEEDWKKKTRDREGWKRLPDEAVKKLRSAPHPRQREKRKRELVDLSIYTYLDNFCTDVFRHLSVIVL